MRRGLVLPFPAPQGLTAADLLELRHFAAGLPGAQLEFFASRSRHRGAILLIAGRRLWIGRTGSTLQVRDEMGAAARAEGGTVADLCGAMRSALLPGGTAVWRFHPHGRRCRTGSLG